jgi:hypothetical protein
MNRFKLLIILSVSFFAACENEDVKPEVKTTIDENWSVELVDSIPGAKAGQFNMLSYDVDSGVHIAYTVHEGTDIRLKYAYKPANGNWSTTNVTNNLLYNDEIDIVVDNQKNVFIVYESDIDESLYLAEKTLDGKFGHVLVDVLGDRSYQARYPALFADNNGTIHLSFERANHGLRYTSYTFQGSFTDVQTLNDVYGGSRSDIVTDSDGGKHIIYHDNGNILYAYSESNSSTWSVSEIATYEGTYQSYEGVSLAIDNSDNLHGVYKSGAYDNNIYYLLKEKISNTWFNETIGNAGGSNRFDRAIACDTLNKPRILYDQDFGLYMASIGTSWQYEHIDGDSDYRCDRNYDLDITDNNQAHVSFYCRSTEVLRYATKSLK